MEDPGRAKVSAIGANPAAAEVIETPWTEIDIAVAGINTPAVEVTVAPAIAGAIGTTRLEEELEIDAPERATMVPPETNITPPAVVAAAPNRTNEIDGATWPAELVKDAPASVIASAVVGERAAAELVAEAPVRVSASAVVIAGAAAEVVTDVPGSVTVSTVPAAVTVPAEEVADAPGSVIASAVDVVRVPAELVDDVPVNAFVIVGAGAVADVVAMTPGRVNAIVGAGAAADVVATAPDMVGATGTARTPADVVATAGLNGEGTSATTKV
jgi:hypothetical protein